MKKALKKLAQSLLPAPIFTKIASVRSRNYQSAMLERLGLFSIARKLVERFGTRVLHGPFEGMEYPRESLLNRHGAVKLLGCYEAELHPFLQEIIEKLANYQGFVDIGCAEGYYAVGLARATEKRVIAFDTEPREIAFCEEMARLNGVSNLLETRNWCDATFLRSLKGQRWFILSDCEGFELELFDAETILALEKCDLIIELHTGAAPNIAEIIEARFAASHHCELVRAQKRAADFEELNILDESERAKAVDEFRVNGMTWALLRAKT